MFLYPIPNLSQRNNDIELTLSPKSHMTFSIVSDHMTHGMEKLFESLSLGGNLFWMIALHSSVRFTVSSYSIFLLLERISFKNFAYEGI